MMEFPDQERLPLLIRPLAGITRRNMAKTLERLEAALR